VVFAKGNMVANEPLQDSRRLAGDNDKDPLSAGEVAMRRLLIPSLIIILSLCLSVFAAKYLQTNNVSRKSAIANPRKVIGDSQSSPRRVVVNYNSEPSMTLTNYLNEDFEGAIFPPTGWMQEIGNISHTWTRAGVPNLIPYSGSYAAYVPWNYSQNERLISPALNFSSADSDLRVEFSWAADYEYMVSPDNNGDYELWLSTNAGSSWSTLLWSVDSIGVFANYDWYRESIDLGAYIGQTNVRLSWLYAANDADDIVLDLVVVADNPINHPINDDCDSITPVPLAIGILVEFIGDNSNATNDCNLSTIPQVWVAFSTDECLDLTLDYCGTNPKFGIVSTLLYPSCPCGGTIYGAEWDTIACGDGNYSIYWFNLQPGTYYYPVLVDSISAMGPYIININGTSCPPPPSNDNCANAGLVGNVYNMPFSTIYATHDGPDTFITSPDIWYRYAATRNDSVRISLCGSSYDTKLAIFDGTSCNPLPPLVLYDDDFCDQQSEGKFQAVIGHNYLIEVGGFGNNTGEGLLTIESGSSGFSVNPTSASGQASAGRIGYDTLTISNTGTARLRYTATTNRTWLNVNPVTDSILGSGPSKISQVLMNSSGLAPGPYAGTITYLTNDPLNPTVDVPVNFQVLIGCNYLPGDINGDDLRGGGDVTYGVRFFKQIGNRPPDSCYMDSTHAWLYAAGDVNGNCEFRGSDITRLVAYFKGYIGLSYCHFFPPPLLKSGQPEKPKPTRER
jgi:hypothetical protein